jgi:hypothetical protein
LSSAYATVSVGASEYWGERPRIGGHHCLIFRGTLDEPVKNATEVQFTLKGDEHPEPGQAKPASVGAVVYMSPQMAIFAELPAVEFKRLWTRADLINYAHFWFTKPYYGTALVTSVMFSGEPVE